MEINKQLGKDLKDNPEWILEFGNDDNGSLGDLYFNDGRNHRKGFKLWLNGSLVASLVTWSAMEKAVKELFRRHNLQIIKLSK